MKKVIFSLVAMTVLATTFISCQSNQKGTDGAATDTTTQAAAKPDTTQSVKPASETANNGKEILSVSPEAKLTAPQFSNEDVNNGFAKFEPIKQEFLAAINSKDDAKIKEAKAKYINWVKDAATWGSKLTQDENQLYIDHYTKLVTQWDKLSLKIKK